MTAIQSLESPGYVQGYFDLWDGLLKLAGSWGAYTQRTIEGSGLYADQALTLADQAAELDSMARTALGHGAAGTIRSVARILAGNAIEEVTLQAAGPLHLEPAPIENAGTFYAGLAVADIDYRNPRAVKSLIAELDGQRIDVEQAAAGTCNPDHLSLILDQLLTLRDQVVYADWGPDPEHATHRTDNPLAQYALGEVGRCWVAVADRLLAPATPEPTQAAPAIAVTPAPAAPACYPIPAGIYTVTRTDGHHRTYRVREEEGEERTTRKVKLLTGPDNESDYRQAVAYLDPIDGRPRWVAKGAQANGWLDDLAVIAAGPGEAGRAYAQRSGNCYRCGRTLTTPESIAAGIGPKCAGL